LIRKQIILLPIDEVRVTKCILSSSCPPGDGAGAAVYARGKEDGFPQGSDFSRSQTEVEKLNLNTN